MIKKILAIGFMLLSIESMASEAPPPSYEEAMRGAYPLGVPVGPGPATAIPVAMPVGPGTATAMPVEPDGVASAMFKSFMSRMYHPGGRDVDITGAILLVEGGGHKLGVSLNNSSHIAFKTPLFPVPHEAGVYMINDRGHHESLKIRLNGEGDMVLGAKVVPHEKGESASKTEEEDAKVEEGCVATSKKYRITHLSTIWDIPEINQTYQERRRVGEKEAVYIFPHLEIFVLKNKIGRIVNTDRYAGSAYITVHEEQIEGGSLKRIYKGFSWIENRGIEKDFPINEQSAVDFWNLKDFLNGQTQFVQSASVKRVLGAPVKKQIQDAGRHLEREIGRLFGRRK